MYGGKVCILRVKRVGKLIIVPGGTRNYILLSYLFSVYCKIMYSQCHPLDPLSPYCRSKMNFSFQCTASCVWHSMEKMAGDPFLLNILTLHWHYHLDFYNETTFLNTKLKYYDYLFTWRALTSPRCINQRQAGPRNLLYSALKMARLSCGRSLEVDWWISPIDMFGYIFPQRNQLIWELNQWKGMCMRDESSQSVTMQ